MSLPVPTEDVEQMHFVQWLELKHYKYTAIPNSTYTKSWKQKRKNTDMGLRAGFPDMVVIAGGVFIAVEMKRTKDSTTSKSQKEWIDALQSAGIPAKVCKGADEAIAFVTDTVKAALYSQQ